MSRVAQPLCCMLRPEPIIHATNKRGTARSVRQFGAEHEEEADSCSCQCAYLLLGLLLGHGHRHHADTAANADASAGNGGQAQQAQGRGDVLVHDHDDRLEFDAGDCGQRRHEEAEIHVSCAQRQETLVRTERQQQGY